MSRAGSSPSQPPPSRRLSSTTSSPNRDTKSSLYEAALAAVQERASEARTRAGQRPRRKRRFPWIKVLLVIAAAELAVLVIRPAWLAGPRAGPGESAGVAAASLRLSLLRERDLVERFRLRTGRAPASLAEAGSTSRGIQYRREGQSFVLSGSAGDSLILLRSSDSVGVFLGESLARLRNRARSAP